MTHIINCLLLIILFDLYLKSKIVKTTIGRLNSRSSRAPLWFFVRLVLPMTLDFFVLLTIFIHQFLPIGLRLLLVLMTDLSDLFILQIQKHSFIIIHL